MNHKTHIISVIYVFSLMFLLSCISINSKETDNKIINNHQAKNNVSGEVKTKKILIGYLDYYLNSQLKKEFQDEKSKEEIDSLGCGQWALTNSEISGILKDMRKVEATEWNSKCYYYPCYLIGSVTNGTESYKIHINSGSFILLYNERETLYFINSEMSDNFLMPCDCCE